MFKAGQKVMLIQSTAHGRSREPGEFVVERVGRKYAYITQYGREVAYHLDTGSEANFIGSPSIIRTLEQYAEDTARETLTARIKAHGWGRIDYQKWPESTETLTKIADLLDQESSDG
jgi:hypothetical protein